MNLPDHVRENKASWEAEAANYVEPARRSWATDEITWGIYDVREADLGALPDVAGMDVVELGCGTAYFSAWLARRGARPVGGGHHREPARHRPRDAGRARPPVPADPGQCRGRAAPRPVAPTSC